MAKRAHRGPTRPKQRPLLAGTLHVSSNGSATVDTAEGTFYIPEGRTGPAMDGDRVQLSPMPAGRGPLPVARVAHVTERAHATFAARYCEDGHLRVLVPLDERLLHDFLVEPAGWSAEAAGVRDGDFVRARVARYPSRREAGAALVEGRIDEDPERVGVEVVIAEHGLGSDFPEAALEEARSLSLDVDAALAEPTRRDLRGRLTVTVDPDDARDFDDALSIEALPQGGWLLGVHIADVSAYVPWGSALDLAARDRSTSVYLADRVIPMLPEELSSGLCSLSPGDDRLAVTVDLALDAQGKVLTAKMYPSVVRSDARLTYRQVDSLLQGRRADVALPSYEAFQAAGVDPAAFFGELDKVRRLRLKLRRERGAIMFVSSEARAVLDEEGRPVGVDVRRPTPATGIVEEAMLMANEAVARRLSAAGAPAAFRVHEPPSHDSLAALAPRLQEVGCLKAGARQEGAEAGEDGARPWPATKAGLLSGDPRAVQAVLDAVAGRPEEELVSQMLLRSMRRAEYAPQNEGHYGLGAASYCHFTSPIRRYPDLTAHRALKSLTAGGAGPKFRREAAEAMPSICKHASVMERVAADAARESQDVKLAEYMAGFVGEAFEGVVVSVQPFGLFVRLHETCATGLLHVRALGPGRWELDERRGELAEASSRRRYRLGQSVRVRVLGADPLRGKIDFALP